MASPFNLFRDYQNDMARAAVALDRFQFDEGLAILDKYGGLLRSDPDHGFLYAQLLQWKGDYAAAEAIWSRVLELDPERNNAVANRATCLANLGRRAEALAMLEAVRAVDLDNGETLGHYLTVLLVERGPAEAIAALGKEHRRRSPPRRLEKPIELLRQKALSLHDAADLKRLDPDNLLEIEPKADATGYTLRTIYETFEPIGCNCEFGFVQRRRGAEPLSLFRWTTILPDNLTRLLACDLEGYERPDIYSLRGDHDREYHLHDSLFETEAHTGVNRSEIAPDEFLNRLTRRQAFLKRKFLADAAEGRKIFLYKAHRPLAEDQIAAIEAQLGRLGVRHALFVLPDPARGGTVDFASPSRAVAYLSSMMPNYQYAEWDKIVIAVYDRFIRNRDAA